MSEDIVLKLNIMPQKKVLSAPYKTKAAFQTLYSDTHIAVFRYIYGLHGGSVHDAEDMTAETFARAWKARTHFNGDGDAALGWLFKIARNLVIDTQRKHKRRKTDIEIEQVAIIATDAGPEEQAIINEQCRTLWHLMSDLPDDKREMLVLRYMLGWRVKQIAQHFDMQENTVSVTIRRTLQKVRANWKGEANG